jgi:hypothetical protein
VAMVGFTLVNLWQDCKAIISLVCGKIVRKPFGSSGLLDPFPLLMNYFLGSVSRINSNSN